MRKLLPLLLLLTPACTSYATFRDVAITAAPTLPEEGSLYVAMGGDGRFEDLVYQGSARVTALAVADAFSPFLQQTIAGSTYEAYQQGLETASSLGFTYYVAPNILHWEDHATVSSGQRDRLEVKLVLIHVPRRQVIDTITVQAKSRLVTLGGDRPQDLLRKPLQSWAASLFVTGRPD